MKNITTQTLIRDLMYSQDVANELARTTKILNGLFELANFQEPIDFVYMADKHIDKIKNLTKLIEQHVDIARNQQGEIT